MIEQKMNAFSRHTGLVATLDRVNVDTDQIIPKQFLKRIERSGFGQFLFYDWRFNPDGSLTSDFALNQPRFGGLPTPLAPTEFGCRPPLQPGPSALQGFRVLPRIAPPLAD